MRVEADGAVRFRSRVRYRGTDGRLRQVERWGSSSAAAQRAVSMALDELTATATSALTGRDTLDEAIRQWMADLEQLERMGQRSPGTLQTYRRQWEGHVSPGLGALRLTQVTTPVVDRFLVDLHERVGAATARTARAVISGAMGRAVREGAIRFNPTREVRRLKSTPRRRPRALTEEERAAWFLAIARDPKAASRDLPDLCAFMLATGLRIGEVLAVVWSEVNLLHGTVEVTSTLLRVTGRGLIRKPTKTDAGQRVLVLPTWCVAMLRRRAAIGVGPEEPVFGTIDGGFREPRTVSRWLFQVREANGMEWVTTHTWRKTTASVLDGSGITARMIADQLGHSRVSMTQDVYLGRGAVDPRVVAALEAADPHREPQSVGQSDGSAASGEGA
ncbi:site-specific integrase [Phycicoccus sp. 3266]|uniref:site-specific integrase n=1 Tax=Phycicoccus sp. 3266 TaxID=2817751 RepID=UPI0028643E83|nr:site-specific integrase [Phycicoccus sp. 3266]MDR6862836.1 integrase [Phycicoccus sp. 3266]